MYIYRVYTLLNMSQVAVCKIKPLAQDEIQIVISLEAPRKETKKMHNHSDSIEFTSAEVITNDSLDWVYDDEGVTLCLSLTGSYWG